MSMSSRTQYIRCWKKICSNRRCFFKFSSTALTPAIIIIEGQRVPLWGVTLKPCPCRRPIWNQPELDSHQKVAGPSGPSKDLCRLVASTKLSIQWSAMALSFWTAKDLPKYDRFKRFMFIHWPCLSQTSYPSSCLNNHQGISCLE